MRVAREPLRAARKLEAQDYIDIRQLIESYSQILDNCTNNGNTYADLFTVGVSSLGCTCGARYSGPKILPTCLRDLEKE